MSGKGSKSGSKSGKPPNNPSSLSVTATSMPLVPRVTKDSTIKEMKSKISALRRRIDVGMARLKTEQRTEADKQKYQDQRRKLIDEFNTELLALKNDAQSKKVIEEMADEVNALEERLKFPNRPPQQGRSDAQLRLRAEAEAIIQDWVDAGHGFDYSTLGPQMKTQLEALIEPSRIHEILAEILLTSEYQHLKNDQSMSTLLESIKKLFLMKLAQSCIYSTGQITINVGNDNHLKYLKALARTCIDRILKSVTGGPPALLALIMQAARDDPTKFARDATSVGFASAVVLNCLPNGAIEAKDAVERLSIPILRFMTHRPAETFVSASWTIPQLRELYKAAIRQMYPGVPPPTIEGLVARMSDEFMQRQSDGLTGEAPLVIATLFDRIASLVYRFKSMCVRQCQFTGDVVRGAMAFPQFVYDMVTYGRLQIKEAIDKANLAMMERYSFVPDASIAGFNDGDAFEDSLMRILRYLEETEGFNFEDVKPFIIRLLVSTKNSIIWQHNVEYWKALSDMDEQFHSPDSGASWGAVKGQESPPQSIDEGSHAETFGIVSAPGEIAADMEWAASEFERNYEKSLRQIKHYASTVAGHAAVLAQLAHNEGEGDGDGDDMPQAGAAVLLQRPSARGGERDPPPSSQAGAQAPPAGAQPGAARGGIVNPSGMDQDGGHSRSRKHSVSKRTRRKGVGKKQKSKKNKRQSRRKVRRASSRKLRK
jgi:hypothetical protein